MHHAILLEVRFMERDVYVTCTEMLLVHLCFFESFIYLYFVSIGGFS